jgi:hypothetical protein
LKSKYPRTLQLLEKDELCLERLKQKFKLEKIPLEWFPSVVKEAQLSTRVIELAWAEHLMFRAHESGDFQLIRITQECPEFLVRPGMYMIMPQGSWISLSKDEIFVLEALEEEIRWTEQLLIQEMALNTGHSAEHWLQVLRNLEGKLQVKLLG